MAAREKVQTILERALAAFNKGDPAPFLKWKIVTAHFSPLPQH